jgi:hypothetical protein
MNRRHLNQGRLARVSSFASADFVAWIEGKLEQHGVAKIVPNQDTLMLAYRPSVASRYVASRLQSAIHDAQRHIAEASVPDDLVTLVAAGLRGDPTQSWDEVVQRLAIQRVGPDEG